jgi:hypothetical protein|nr:MAG TPA: hypothetical protein [Caudoviricetes sp.]
MYKNARPKMSDKILRQSEMAGGIFIPIFRKLRRRN